MKTHGEMTLEKHKFFPFVAWFLFFGFTFFTGHLALELQHMTKEASTRTEQLQALVNDNSARLDELEAAEADTD